MRGVAGRLRVGYARGVQRDEVIAALRAHEADFRQAGVVALSVFGSVARDDAVDGSDVDVLVRLEDALLRSGFQYFGRLATLEERLRNIERIERFTAGMDREAFVSHEHVISPCCMRC
jgi:uncharacterized protein